MKFFNLTLPNKLICFSGFWQFHISWVYFYESQILPISGQSTITIWAAGRPVFRWAAQAPAALSWESTCFTCSFHVLSWHQVNNTVFYKNNFVIFIKVSQICVLFPNYISLYGIYGSFFVNEVQERMSNSILLDIVDRYKILRQNFLKSCHNF